MATIGGAEGQNLNCKIVCTLIFIAVLSLQDKIGNFKVATGIFMLTYIVIIRLGRNLMHS